MTALHHRTCNLCEAMCGVVVEHDGTRVLSIRGDEDDPLSRGAICPKAVALKDLYEDPDRLRRPQRRAGDRWQDVGWDEALDASARRIVDIQRKYGPSSVAMYLGNPTVHNTGALTFGLGFLKTLGTKNRFSATSVDQLPHMFASLEMFGHQAMMPVPDVDRCDYLLVLGANPIVSNGSLMTAPGFKRRVQTLQRRGGKLVVVDPRFTETAKIADRHLYIRPGSDGLFLAALLATLYEEKLVRPGRLAAFTDGIDELGRLVAPYRPERVASATGIDAAAIREVARAFAAAKQPACYGRVGLCTQRFGGVNAWLVNALNVVTGSLDRPGGMMFTKPAVDLVQTAVWLGQTGHFAKGHTRVRGLPEFGGEYPAVALAEEIAEPGEGQIKALITFAGNPVLSTPNGRKLDEALGKLELMVSIDIYRNETTRHADYILPPIAALEQSHYDLALHAFAVRNTAKWSPPLFEPPADARADWQILLELGTRIDIARGGAGAVAARARRAIMSRLGPDGIVDALLRIGPHGVGRGGLTVEKLARSPHGVDLGPLEPCLPKRLPKKRIDLVPRRIVGDLRRLEALIDEPAGTLTLIGRRQLRTNNSWLHNSERMLKGRDRCTLIMHEDDAAARGLAHGQRVSIRSRVGEVVTPLHVCRDIMPGVVSLPHGFGHDRPGMQLSVASGQPGASINDLTDEAFVDELTGTAALNGVSVTVQAAGERADAAAE